METMNYPFPWLELMDRPAFCVKDGFVTAVNTAAENRMLRVGMDVRDIVTEHREAYETFENGSLYLTITAGELPCDASVIRTKECDVFILQQDVDNDLLQALSLAAQQLRIPLSNVMTVAGRILAESDRDDAEAQQQANQLNHNLFQLLRIISNMSDAGHYHNPAGMQTAELSAVFDEIMEKIQTVAAGTGVTVTYCGLNTPVFGLVNTEKLERAVYNLLSNALKFSCEGSAVEASLTQNGKLLSFTVCNTHPEPLEEGGCWNRYRREPSLDDSRYGLGLGMTLIKAVASAHGGTVLIDHPSPLKTRVTMTIAIKENAGVVRSPVLRVGDYAGGWDKGLLEFAEILSPDAYNKIN